MKEAVCIFCITGAACTMKDIPDIPVDTKKQTKIKQSCTIITNWLLARIKDLHISNLLDHSKISPRTSLNSYVLSLETCQV